MDRVKSRRPYSSAVRTAAARATREAVLEAARALFVEQGYTATSVEQIADRAGVSRPTVFTAVGSKRALLAELRERALAGDDEPVPVRERAWFRAMLDDPDPAGTLRRYAAGVTGIASRYAEIEEVLHGAAGADDEIRELWRTNEQQRLAGTTLVVDNLLTKGRLRLERDVARDVLWVLVSTESYRRLVIGRGWSAHAYEQWLATTMLQQLLP